MSTTSKQYPDASIRSPSWGTRRRRAMTRPPRVRNSRAFSPFTESVPSASPDKGGPVRRIGLAGWL